MKKILSIMVLLAGVMTFTACSDDETTYTAPAKLELKSADAFFEAAGGTGAIVVNSSEAISATSNADWLTVSVSGNTVSLNVAANDNLEGRSTNVILKTATASSEVNISQRGVVYGIATDGKLEINDLPGTYKIDIDHTSNVSVTSLADWLTASFDNATNKVVITAADNSTLEQREGKVAIATGNVRDTLVVVQNPMVFSVSTNSLQIADNGENTVSFVIKHSKPLQFAKDAEWINLSMTSETDTVVTVTVPANEGVVMRNAHIYVKAGDAIETILVSQYDFAAQVPGYYYLWYLSSKDNKWHYYPAAMSSELMMFGLTDEVIMSVPVSVDAENQVVKAGPSTSYMGAYGNYFIYLAFLTDANTWTGYTGKGYSVGEYIIEEYEGAVGEYFSFGGTYGKNQSEIIAWMLRAMGAEGMSEANNLGNLAILYYPELEKDNAPAEARGASKVRTFRGHTGTPAGDSELQYVLR